MTTIENGQMWCFMSMWLHSNNLLPTIHITIKNPEKKKKTYEAVLNYLGATYKIHEFK